MLNLYCIYQIKLFWVLSSSRGMHNYSYVYDVPYLLHQHKCCFVHNGRVCIGHCQHHGHTSSQGCRCTWCKVLFVAPSRFSHVNMHIDQPWHQHTKFTSFTFSQVASSTWPSFIFYYFVIRMNTWPNKKQQPKCSGPWLVVWFIAVCKQEDWVNSPCSADLSVQNSHT